MLDLNRLYMDSISSGSIALLAIPPCDKNFFYDVLFSHSFPGCRE